MITTREYRGRIGVRDNYDYADGLYLDEDPEPLAMSIEEDIENHGRYLYVAYWITDEPHPKDEVHRTWIRTLLGDSDVEFRVHGSDITGYLWTDEKINVGGHDLLAELASNKGKYVHLEISYSPVEQARHDIEEEL